eukprot:gene19062-biopygen17463
MSGGPPHFCSPLLRAGSPKGEHRGRVSAARPPRPPRVRRASICRRVDPGCPGGWWAWDRGGWKTRLLRTGGGPARILEGHHKDHKKPQPSHRNSPHRNPSTPGALLMLQIWMHRRGGCSVDTPGRAWRGARGVSKIFLAEPSRNHAGTHRERTGNLPRTYRKPTVNLPGTYRLPGTYCAYRKATRNLPKTDRKPTGNPPETYREPTGNLPCLHSLDIPTIWITAQEPPYQVDRATWHRQDDSGDGFQGVVLSASRGCRLAL